MSALEAVAAYQSAVLVREAAANTKRELDKRLEAARYALIEASDAEQTAYEKMRAAIVAESAPKS